MKRNIEIIPKIHLRDKKSYIENKTICFNAYELFMTENKNNQLFKNKYFDQKEKIITSVFPDDLDFDYLDYLLKIFDSKDKSFQNNLKITTCDAPVYDDMDQQTRNYELEILKDDNNKLEIFIKECWSTINIIKLLKGSTIKEFENNYNHLKTIFPNQKTYMMYLSGNIRSNPFTFNALSFLREKIPFFSNKNELYLYGFNPGSIKDLELIKKEFNIKGIITETHLADAKYRGHRKYKFETRIKKSWEKYLKLFS